MTTYPNQNVLKSIAKLSNFNVDIQVRPTFGLNTYRALCSACKADIAIESDVVRGLFDESFEKFCKDHRHEKIVEVSELLGRKFKNV